MGNGGGRRRGVRVKGRVEKEREELEDAGGADGLRGKSEMEKEVKEKVDVEDVEVEEVTRERTINESPLS